MQKQKVVSSDEWLVAREKFLQQEKEFTRMRDELSQARRELPWRKVQKDYVFTGPAGQETLADLFGECQQLLIYHFMLGPGWKEGCPSCSFLADNFNGVDIHLKQRDITMVAVSRAPLDEIEAYKKRMGWGFNWVSSHGSEFNFDCQVSFDAEDMNEDKVYYNYKEGSFPSEEGPGISVFYKDEQGEVFHTYSTYARGLDMLIGAYHFMDLVPKGRDEAELPFTMAWIKRHDQY